MTSVEPNIPGSLNRQISTSGRISSTSGGSRGRVWRFFHRYEYSTAETERLFRMYMYPTCFGALQSMLILMIAVTVSLSIVNFIFVSRLSLENISNAVLCVLFVIILIALHTRYMSVRLQPAVSLVLVVLCLVFAAVSFPIDEYILWNKDFRKQNSQAEGVWRLAYVVFILYVFIPLRLYIPLTVGLLLPLIHCLIAVLVPTNVFPSLLWRQVSANVVLFVGVNVVGLYLYTKREKAFRKLFNTVRASTSASLHLVDENDKTDRLLGCMLPQHVICEMKADLGTPHLRDLYQKVYIQQHDSVSILFGDIVGLSSISSQCTVHELIRFLNEVFGRFDQLALENHCLRIQILGDRYFCISGAPDPRPDHAKCSVEMGLDMIDFISFIRNSTNVNIQIRIGIHTGRILCGVVGLRKWQYDVWSNDVVLASQTEQAGLPGRVQITRVTLDHLQGEFATEAGYGEDRCPQLKAQRLNTFLIVAEQPRKHYALSKLPMNPRPHGRLSLKTIDCVISAIKFNVELPFCNVVNGSSQKGFKNRKGDDVSLLDRISDSSSSNRNNSINHWDRMRKHLHQSILNKILRRKKTDFVNYVTLGFKSSNRENTYQRAEDTSLSSELLCSLILLVASIALHAVILPRTILLLVLFLISFAWISLILIILLGFRIKCVNCDVRKSAVGRRLVTSITLILICSVSLVNVLCCRGGLLFPDKVGSTAATDSIISFNRDYHLDCEVPQYIYLSAIFPLLSALVFLRMSAGIRLLFWIVSAAGYVVAIEYVDRGLFTKFDSKMRHGVPSDVSGILMLLHFVISLYVGSRDLEWIWRLNFLWVEQVKQQNTELNDVENVNKGLVMNVLPDHVAPYFTNTSDRTISDLYSHSYSQVAVLFTSVTNFCEFYSELASKNRVTESLRVIHDIISAYDKVLEERRFKSIVKIKTSGTTYVACVGLGPDDKIDETNDSKRRHLSVVVEFLLALKDSLVSLNRGRLMFKAGVDIGPVIAGVIGARKPQYEIFGDCVNIASIMDSSSPPNFIQVTESVYQPLRNDYQFQCRGRTKLKERGDVLAYFLLGRNTVPNDVVRMNGPLGSGLKFSSPGGIHPDMQNYSDVPAGPVGPVHGKSPSSSSLVPLAMSPERQMNGVVSSPTSSGSRVINLNKISMTPPSSLGRRRAMNDEIANEPARKMSGPGLTLVIPAEPIFDDRGRSPDLPVFHYSKVQSSGSLGKTENTLTQSQVLGNPARNQSDQSLCQVQTSPRTSMRGSSGMLCNDGGKGYENGPRTPNSPRDVCPNGPFVKDANKQKGKKGGACTTEYDSYLASILESNETNEKVPEAIFAVSGSKSPVLSRSELDDIDQIMKEFSSAIGRKQTLQAALNCAASPARCVRSVSDAGKHARPCPVSSPHVNRSNGAPQHAFQPPAELVQPTQVKNAPRVSLVYPLQRPLETNPLQRPSSDTKTPTNSDDGGVYYFESKNLDKKLVTSPKIVLQKTIDEHSSAQLKHSNSTGGGHAVFRGGSAFGAPSPLNRPHFLGPPSSSSSKKQWHNPAAKNTAHHSNNSSAMHQPILPKKSFPASRKGAQTNLPTASFQVKRHKQFLAPPRSRSLDRIPSDLEDIQSCSSDDTTSPIVSRRGKRDGGVALLGDNLSKKGQGLLLPDNISLSSFNSEMSRSDPALSYESSSAMESEYDNYRPGMASDEDYFVMEPVSDIDLDMFDEINIDNVQVQENYNNYMPSLQKFITDI